MKMSDGRKEALNNVSLQKNFTCIEEIIFLKTYGSMYQEATEEA